MLTKFADVQKIEMQNKEKFYDVVDMLLTEGYHGMIGFDGCCYVFSFAFSDPQMTSIEPIWIDFEKEYVAELKDDEDDV